MALNNLGLGLTITATNLASGTLRRVRGDVSTTSATVVAKGLAMKAGFGAAAGGAIALLGGVMAVRGALGAANAAGEFQQGIAAVGAVANATTEELKALRDTAIQAGVDTQFSPTEAVEGLQSLITAGQTATQATSTLIPVLDLAAGSLGQLGVAGAAEAVVGTLNSYQIAADEAGNITDRLLRITQLTNFQARDFAAGLAKAAAAGATFGQGLDDTLITMGLLRNANIDASSASTAFRESVRRLGSDQNAQNSIKNLVDIFDDAGEMRSVVDIMMDLSEVTADQTAEERNALVARAFGARGLLAFNAVSKATFTTMQDGVEVTLKGRKAIEALRREMDNAGGAAERMRNQLLDTYAGQKQLLQGTLQTMQIVFGEAFADLMKPIVKFVVETLNKVLQFFEGLPAGAKKAIAMFITFGGVAFIVLGVMTLLAAAFAFLLPMLPAMAIAFIGMTIVMLPLIAIFGTLAATIYMFVVAARRNLGGFGDWVTGLWNKIKLGFNALVQLFTEGRLSGAVLKEMVKAENAGVFKFVRTIYLVGRRVLEFFAGVKEALSAAFDAMAPLFRELWKAFEGLGEAFGMVGDSIDSALETTGLSSFTRAGHRFGLLLSTAIKFVVRWVILFVKWWTGFVKGIREAWRFVQPAIDEMKAAFGRLGGALNALGSDGVSNLESAAGGAEGAGRNFGHMAAAGISGIAQVITGLIDFALWMGRTYRKVERFVKRIGFAFERAGMFIRGIWRDIFNWIANRMDALQAILGDIASYVPEGMRTQAIQDIIDKGGVAEQNIRNRTADDIRQDQADATRRAAIMREDREMEMQARKDEASASGNDAMLARLEQIAGKRNLAEREQLLQVQLTVDGEQLAGVTADGMRLTQARGFRTVNSPE